MLQQHRKTDATISRIGFGGPRAVSEYLGGRADGEQACQGNAVRTQQVAYGVGALFGEARWFAAGNLTDDAQALDARFGAQQLGHFAGQGVSVGWQLPRIFSESDALGDEGLCLLSAL